MSAWPSGCDADVTVVGGGMAGCEAAWQLALRGLRVALVEQKPTAMSPAHQTPLLGELVCSNSLRSDDADTPAGLLKHELRRAGSMVIACADQTRVPAGAALAVDRIAFGRALTVRLALHPRIRIERRPLDELPAGPVIVATGPLTGGPLGRVIRRELGGERMYFYDAIAPIVAAESVDHEHAFHASRWGKDGDQPGAHVAHVTREGHGEHMARAAAAKAAAGEADLAGEGGEGVLLGDYINCPLDQETYLAFVAAIRAGRQVSPHEFEEREKELLVLAKAWIPRLPFKTADILLIDEMGKNISGTGMDTNVIGRKYNDHAAVEGEWPKVKRLIVRGLTEATHGNATGIGMAEFCRTRLVEEMDKKITRINCLTGGHPVAAMIPLDYPTDREILDVAFPTIGLTEPPEAKLMWIHNTLEVSEVECSAAYYHEARERADLTILREPRPMPFDASGNLPDHV